MQDASISIYLCATHQFSSNVMEIISQKLVSNSQSTWNEKKYEKYLSATLKLLSWNLYKLYSLLQISLISHSSSTAEDASAAAASSEEVTFRAGASRPANNVTAGFVKHK